MGAALSSHRCDVHGDGLQHISRASSEKHISPILQYVWGHVFPLPKSFIRKLMLFYLFVSAGVLHTMALQHLESVWEGPAEALVLSHPLAALTD